MAELKDAPARALAAASGYVVAMTDAAQPVFQRIPVADLLAIKAVADSALPASAAGDAASMSVADVQAIVDERIGDVAAALDAILGA